MQKLNEHNQNFSINADQILELFLDSPGKAFSIHSIIEEGRKVMSKEPGDWYGVNSITQVIKRIFDQNQGKIEKEYNIFSKLRFLTFQEG